MKYLFYKIYQILKKVKTNDTPATNSMIILSITQGINLLILQLLLSHFFNIKLYFWSKKEIILYELLIGLILYIINYIKLYKKREEIWEKYKDEGKKQSSIGYTILILYIIGSAALMYFVGSKYPI